MKNGEETAEEQARRDVLADLEEVLSLIRQARELAAVVAGAMVAGGGSVLDRHECRAMALVVTRLDESALWGTAVLNVGWPEHAHGLDLVLAK